MARQNPRARLTAQRNQRKVYRQAQVDAANKKKAKFQKEAADLMSYPSAIAAIPYASFIRIHKYEYNEGLKKVASGQNDALGSVQRSAIFGKTTKAVGFVAEHFYGSGGGADADQPALRLANQLDTKGVAIKGNKRGRATAWSRDPNDLTSAQQQMIENSGMDDTTTITLPNGTETTMKELYKDKGSLLENRKKGLQSSMVQIALPNEFSYGYDAEWGNKFKLGTLALAADNAWRMAGIGIAGGLANIGLNKAMGELNKRMEKMGGGKADQYSQYAAQGASGAKRAMGGIGGVTSELNMKNVAGLAGLAPNENAIQMFTKMNMRKFDLTFEFAARNAAESATITSIIEWFKRGMHPNSRNGKGSAVLLTFPDVFVLEPMYVPADEKDYQQTPIQHPMMPKTKLCALTGLKVDTAPLGQFSTIFDGTIPLVKIQLNFMETTALTRVDFEGARTRKNSTFSGKSYVRSSMAKNHPVVGF